MSDKKRDRRTAAIRRDLARRAAPPDTRPAPVRGPAALGPLTEADMDDADMARARLEELSALLAELRAEFEAHNAEEARARKAREVAALPALRAAHAALKARERALEAEGMPLVRKVKAYETRARLFGQMDGRVA